MEHSTVSDEQNSQRSFTIFGEPIVKTNCQRNGWICGISGGIISGLVGFLFTSNPKKSTYIGFSGYIAITSVMACYCWYNEHTLRKQARLIRKTIHEVNMLHKTPVSSESAVKSENT